jgi:hypothetical protein
LIHYLLCTNSVPKKENVYKWGCLIFSYLVLFSVSIGGLIFIKNQNDSVYKELTSSVNELKEQLTVVQTQNADFARRYNFLETTFSETQKKQQDFENLTSSQLVVFSATADNLSKDILNQNITITNKIQLVNKLINTHETVLTRLTNGTTNAEVLEKLKATKGAIDLQLDRTTSLVYQKLKESAVNVSRSLSFSKSELRATQGQLEGELSSSLDNMKLVVSEAASLIHGVETNVTAQMDQISDQLATTVSALNQAVAVAQSTIHGEVEIVRNNIEQYVAVTNKQFATENDFVKYQLAGASL